MIENIRLLRLDPREYYKDILGLSVVGFGTNAFITWFVTSLVPLYLKTIQKIGALNNVVDYIRSATPTNYDYFPLSMVYIKISVWLFVYLLLRKYFLLRVRPLFNKWSGERLFENSFSLDKSKLEEKWDFQGNVDVTKDGIQITNTPSGCLIKNDYWDTKVWANLSVIFEVDLTKKVGIEDDWFVNKKGEMKDRKYEIRRKELDFRKVLGIIFRSQGFDDYFMIGMWKVENNLVFRPHVRVAGNLDIPYLNPPTNTFPVNDKAIIFYFKMLVKDNKTIVYVKQKRKWKECFHWYLPSFYKTNLNEGTRNDNTSEFITRKIPFRDLPGQFGFRNYGNELSVIKTLKIYGKFTDEDNKS